MSVTYGLLAPPIAPTALARVEELLGEAKSAWMPPAVSREYYLEDTGLAGSLYGVLSAVLGDGFSVESEWVSPLLDLWAPYKVRTELKLGSASVSWSSDVVVCGYSIVQLGAHEDENL